MHVMLICKHIISVIGTKRILNLSKGIEIYICILGHIYLQEQIQLGVI